jgi:hypothetical protein
MRAGDGKRHVEFLRVFEYATATAIKISEDLAALILALAQAGVLVVASVTGNGSNLIAALSHKRKQPLAVKDSVQAMTGMALIHGSCVNHTSMLIWTSGEAEITGLAAFRAFISGVISSLGRKEMKALLRAAGVTAKLPRIQTAKWTTEAKCAAFVENHWSVIRQIRETIRAEGKASLQGPEGELEAFRGILDVLVPFREFTERVERNATTMADAWLELQELRETLAALASGGSATAGEVLGLLNSRFATTADGVMMELAYVFTPQGHKRYHQLAVWSTLSAEGVPDDAEAAVAAFASDFDAMRAKTAELGVYSFPEICASAFGGAFDAYMLDGNAWGPSDQTPTGWGSKARAALARKPPAAPMTSELAFIKLAQVLTEMPASEAAAERAISTFEYIFDKSRMSSGVDLIQAELMIRFWRTNHPGEKLFIDAAKPDG